MSFNSKTWLSWTWRHDKWLSYGQPCASPPSWNYFGGFPAFRFPKERVFADAPFSGLKWLFFHSENRGWEVLSYMPFVETWDGTPLKIVSARSGGMRSPIWKSCTMTLGQEKHCFGDETHFHVQPHSRRASLRCDPSLGDCICHTKTLFMVNDHCSSFPSRSVAMLFQPSKWVLFFLLEGNQTWKCTYMVTYFCVNQIVALLSDSGLTFGCHRWSEWRTIQLMPPEQEVKPLLMGTLCRDMFVHTTRYHPSKLQESFQISKMIKKIGAAVFTCPQ